MPQREDYGYLSNPTNGLGIVRSRTLIGNLRIWDIPRSEEALDTVVDEIGRSPLPGLYMLFDERTDKKVYIGQTENLKSRLSTHLKTPDEKIKNWDRAIIINDARNSSYSDFNDENIRQVLEDFLVRLFRINKYKVVTSSSRTPSLSSTQKTLCESFKEEIVILLTNKSKITKALKGRRDDERYLDDVKRVLEQRGREIQKWSNVEAIMGGSKVFIRPGSPKPGGWQVIFRGGKPDSSKSMLVAGDGFLLMPRGPIMFIPLKVINELVSSIDVEAYLSQLKLLQTGNRPKFARLNCDNSSTLKMMKPAYSLLK